MNIPKILSLIRPTAEWTLRGETLDDLTWHSTDSVKPTPEEMQAGEAQLNDLAYREKRAKEYPAIGDQLDAMWKGGSAFQDMLTQIQAVKAKYPKPL